VSGNHFAVCDGCGAPAPCTVQKDFPDGGLCLDPYSLGYYAGYIDPPFADDRMPVWKLCRDCAHKLFQMFPALIKKYEDHINFLLDDGQIAEIGGGPVTDCCG